MNTIFLHGLGQTASSWDKTISHMKSKHEIVCGAKDRANIKAARELANLLKNVKLHILDGITHEVNVQAPEELAGLINEYAQ